MIGVELVIADSKRASAEVGRTRIVTEDGVLLVQRRDVHAAPVAPRAAQDVVWGHHSVVS